MIIDKAIIDSKDYNDYGGPGKEIDFSELGYEDFNFLLLDMTNNVKEDPEKSITIVTKSTGGGMKYKRNRRSRRIRRTKKNKSKKRKSKKKKKKSKRNKK
tara:strand:- start:621 stop:920 length:300 start_codon:yes stop_codon:yes gene_type:complete